MGDMISREAVLEQICDWSKDEFLRVTNPLYYLHKRINSLSPVNPKPCNALKYLETAYTGARACDDVEEQVRLARAIAAYKQDVHEDCTVVNAAIEADKEDINTYEKCKTCGQNRESCCGCPEVLELEQEKRRTGE